MRTLLLAAACIAFVGCTFGANTCKTNADCTVGTCDPSGFCVGGSGGGTTGGGTTGSGGGTTGGGGGATGGGGGGGGVDLCLGTSCPAGYSCEPATGVCLLRVTGLDVYAPPDGTLTSDAGVFLRARLTTDAAVMLPASLSYQLDNGPVLPLGPSGGDYGLPLTLGDGPHLLSVSVSLSDAGFSGSTNVTVDTQGPTLTGTLPATVQQRDEIFTLDLTASEAIQAGSVEVRLSGVQLVVSTGACTASAGCWTVDLSLPALDSLTGAFPVTATAMDTVGNTKTSNVGTVNVTRKRWEVAVTGEEFRAAPAVGFDGRLFLGSRASGTAGTLFALNPQDGGTLNATAVGAFQSVATAVSNDAGLVYYTANDTQGRVGARLASDLSAGALQVAASNNSPSPTYSALALVGKSAAEVGAVAAFNSVSAGAVSGRVVIYGSASILESVGTTGDTFDFAAVPNPLDVAANIVVNGNTEAYLLTRNIGTGVSWQPITNVNATPTSGAPQPIEAFPIDCCLAGQTVLGSGSLIAGITAARKFYRVTGGPPVGGDLGSAFDKGVPALASAMTAFAGRGGDLVRFNPSQLSSGAIALKSGSGAIRTSPVLGKARSGQSVGLGYAVNSVGNLYAFAQDGNADSAKDWGAVFSGSPNIYAHPTLDCNRRGGAATATTGILYVASSTGRVAAIVVDSPKLLDTVGAWPKYQRTAGNAGNTDARFALNPGCP